MPTSTEVSDPILFLGNIIWKLEEFQSFLPGAGLSSQQAGHRHRLRPARHTHIIQGATGGTIYPSSQGSI